MRAINPYVGMMETNPVIQKYFSGNGQAPFETWPRQRIEQYQIEALSQMLRHVDKENEYYRKKFELAGFGPEALRTLKDFERVPFLLKDEVRRKPLRTLSLPKDQIAQVHISTGTTSQSVGDHLYSLLSWDDIFLNEVATRFGLLMPHRAGDIVVVALPYEMSSAAFSMHRAYQNTLNAIVVNVGKGGWYSEPRKIVMAMRDLKASILCTTAPFALWLAETAEELGINVKEDVGLKLMWLGGEGFSNPLRKRVEELWGCVCLTYYSSLECGPMGIECVAQKGLHVPENYVYLEVIDPVSGEVVPDGVVGEVCVTNLYRFGAPFVRYRTQDAGWIDHGVCPCCYELPRLFLKGRVRDQIAIGGQSISPYEVEAALYSCPAMGNNYYIMDKGGTYDVHVEVRRGHSADSLMSGVRDMLKERAPEEVIIHERIPRSLGKTTRVRREEDRKVD